MLEVSLAALVLLVVCCAVVTAFALAAHSRGGLTQTKAESPSFGWEYIVTGLLISATGGGALIAEAPMWLFGPLLWVATTLATVGVVAAGVTLGMMRADWNRTNR
jgi:hypothetical protein